jgi:hypothetical protein
VSTGSRVPSSQMSNRRPQWERRQGRNESIPTLDDMTTLPVWAWPDHNDLILLVPYLFVASAIPRSVLCQSGLY